MIRAIASMDRPRHAVTVICQLGVLRMVAGVFDVHDTNNPLSALVTAGDKLNCDSQRHGCYHDRNSAGCQIPVQATLFRPA